jgi:hypothetical protein
MEAAVTGAGQILSEWLAVTVDDGLSSTPAAGGLRSSVLRRLMLVLARLCAVLEQALDRMPLGDAPAVWTMPTRSADLFAIGAAHFYEQDRAAHFWDLPRALKSELPEACNVLEQALASRR